MPARTTGRKSLPSSNPIKPDPIDQVRRFNRFYTRTIGVLSESHLGGPHSLAELRVLYEIAHGERSTAAEIASELGLDAGYLSRILRRLERDGLVARRRSEEDARQSHLKLTRRGRTRFAALEDDSRAHVRGLLDPLSADARTRLTGAMRTITSTLAASPSGASEIVLRPPGPGDLGWVVYRHGLLYCTEYGWNAEFEGLVASIVADFAAHFDPEKERGWIAERDGEKLGFVFLVKKSPRVAQLRMLLVEPAARGLGLGGRLVDECTRFAHAAGYRRIVLLTNSRLASARYLYTRAGYRLIAEEREHVWGADQISKPGSSTSRRPIPTAP